MPLVPAKCPQCGAQLKVNSEQDAAICEYCNTPFVIEKAINNYNVVNNFTGANVVIHESDITSVDNLLTLARRAISDSSYTKAAGYYDGVLIREPNNIEAYFYSKFCSTYSRLGLLPIQDMQSLVKITPNSIARIDQSNMKYEEKVSMVMGIVNACQDIIVSFNNVVHQKILEQRRIPKQPVVINTGKVCESLMLNLANALHERFPKEVKFQNIYIPVWKDLAENFNDKKIRKLYEQKIQQYEPDYKSSYGKTDKIVGIVVIAFSILLSLSSGEPSLIIVSVLAGALFYCYQKHIA